MADPVPPGTQSWPWVSGRASAVLLALIGPTVLTFFVLATDEPRWQSGELADYVRLVLRNSIYVFAPLVLYATLCLVLATYAPQRTLPHFAVRFGVYSGLPLSLQPIVVASVLAVANLGGDIDALLDFGVLAALILVGLFLPLGTVWLMRNSTRVWGRRAVGLSAATLTGLTVFLGPAVFVAAPFLAAPFWTLAAYGALSRAVYRRYGGRGQFRLVDLLGLLTWSSVYLASWRLSVTLALEKYATLPKSPPRCYVCTAAARGHQWLVQSDAVRSKDGGVFFANRQMRRLKGAELVLSITAPRLHRAMRTVYDRLGPPLARRIEQPLVADLAYLALKPLEWLATFLARRLVPRFDELCQRLYANTV